MSISLIWEAAPARDLERPGDVLAAAGLLGLAFQLLFWGAVPGVSFPLFVAAALAAVWWSAQRHGVAAVPSSVALTATAGLLAGAVAVRAEPLTTVVNVLTVTGLLAVLVHAYGSDGWLRYGMRDWLLAALRLSGHEVTGAPGLLRATHRRRSSLRPGSGRGRAWQVVRGIAIAAPLVIVLATLLASADVVFASRLDWFTLSVPGADEAVGRLLLALVAAYVAAGGLWHLLQRREEPVIAEQAIPRVLGFVEAVIVLVSVGALFAGFVAIQLRYFFGGHDALIGGLTHAEYARRGFAELVVVAAVTLALHLALAGLTRRETPAQRWAFTALTAALTGLTLVILASAFQRLLLYEQAFGFTRSRTVAHAFMVWLGLLLVAVVVLELLGRVRLFLLVSIVAVVGFAATLNVVGVDALIARHNLARAAQGAELDVAYLSRLSPDAVPVLASALPELEPALAADVATAVVCIRDRAEGGDWRSWRLADARARAALDAASVRAALDAAEGRGTGGPGSRGDPPASGAFCPSRAGPA